MKSYWYGLLLATVFSYATEPEPDLFSPRKMSKRSLSFASVSEGVVAIEEVFIPSPPAAQSYKKKGLPPRSGKPDGMPHLVMVNPRKSIKLSRVERNRLREPRPMRRTNFLARLVGSCCGAAH